MGSRDSQPQDGGKVGDTVDAGVTRATGDEESDAHGDQVGHDQHREDCVPSVGNQDARQEGS